MPVRSATQAVEFPTDDGRPTKAFPPTTAGAPGHPPPPAAGWAAVNLALVDDPPIYSLLGATVALRRHDPAGEKVRWSQSGTD